MALVSICIAFHYKETFDIFKDIATKNLITLVYTNDLFFTVFEAASFLSYQPLTKVDIKNMVWKPAFDIIVSEYALKSFVFDTLIPKSN